MMSSDIGMFGAEETAQALGALLEHPDRLLMPAQVLEHVADFARGGPDLGRVRSRASPLDLGDGAPLDLALIVGAEAVIGPGERPPDGDLHRRPVGEPLRHASAARSSASPERDRARRGRGLGTGLDQQVLGEETIDRAERSRPRAGRPARPQRRGGGRGPRPRGRRTPRRGRGGPRPRRREPGRDRRGHALGRGRPNRQAAAAAAASRAQPGDRRRDRQAGGDDRGQRRQRGGGRPGHVARGRRDVRDLGAPSGSRSCQPPPRRPGRWIPPRPPVGPHPPPERACGLSAIETPSIEA